MSAVATRDAEPSTPLAIQTEGLTRTWGKAGVSDLDLNVPRGNIFGFLGPNGAGKTTTIRMLLGLLKPTSGLVVINGIALHENRLAALSGVGALVETPSLYPHLSVFDNLRVTAKLLELPEQCLPDVLATVGLRDARDVPVSKCSLGMRQRLGLALALLPNPSLLILDEPSNGLDPAGMADMRSLLRHLALEHGKTLFLSSHLLGEIEQVATHVAVIDKGRLVFQGELANLQACRAPTLEIRTTEPARAVSMLSAAGETVRELEDGLVLVEAPKLSASFINRQLVGAGIDVELLLPGSTSLENVFLGMTTNTGELT